MKITSPMLLDIVHRANSLRYSYNMPINVAVFQSIKYLYPLIDLSEELELPSHRNKVYCEIFGKLADKKALETLEKIKHYLLN